MDIQADIGPNAVAVSALAAETAERELVCRDLCLKAPAKTSFLHFTLENVRIRVVDISRRFGRSQKASVRLFFGTD
jgi:hypothetical protein